MDRWDSNDGLNIWFKVFCLGAKLRHLQAGSLEIRGVLVKAHSAMWWPSNVGTSHISCFQFLPTPSTSILDDGRQYWEPGQVVKWEDKWVRNKMGQAGNTHKNHGCFWICSSYRQHMERGRKNSSISFLFSLNPLQQPYNKELVWGIAVFLSLWVGVVVTYKNKKGAVFYGFTRIMTVTEERDLCLSFPSWETLHTILVAVHGRAWPYKDSTASLH